MRPRTPRKSKRIPTQMKTIPIVCLIMEAPPFEDLGEGQRGDEAQKRPDEGDVHEKSLVVKEAEQGQDTDDEDTQDVHGDDPVGRAGPADDPVKDEEGAKEADVDELDQERRLEHKKVEEGQDPDDAGSGEPARDSHSQTSFRIRSNLAPILFVFSSMSVPSTVMQWM